MTQSNSRIIVALDNLSRSRLFELVHLLTPYVWGFKVNDALVDEGATIISDLKSRDTRVFSDPKVHDIPATHANTVEKHALAGADFITVHASAGLEALQASVQAADEASNDTCRILCMMVPTSLSNEQCKHIYRGDVRSVMYRLGLIGAEAGVYGFICGPPDLTFMRSHKEFKGRALVTPGIRPEGSPPDDQKRKATPTEAISMGSDLLVIGRPITLADDPIRVVKEMNQQIAEA